MTENEMKKASVNWPSTLHFGYLIPNDRLSNNFSWVQGDRQEEIVCLLSCVIINYLRIFFSKREMQRFIDSSYRNHSFICNRNYTPSDIASVNVLIDGHLRPFDREQ